MILNQGNCQFQREQGRVSRPGLKYGMLLVLGIVGIASRTRRGDLTHTDDTTRWLHLLRAELVQKPRASANYPQFSMRKVRWQIHRSDQIFYTICLEVKI
jgi:hypothetical protein